MELIYEELTHSYWLNGQKKRALSDVLDVAEVELCRRFSIPYFGLTLDLRFVRDHIRENVCARNSQVDHVNSRILEGKWNEQDEWGVSEEALPLVCALYKYWEAHLAEVHRPSLAVQTPLYCPALDFCTLPDWHDAESVNDLKCGKTPSRTWGLRMAGQALAHGRARVQRVVQLEPHLKTRKWSVFVRSKHFDARVYHPLDEAVVRAAALERFDDPIFEQWKGRIAA